MVRGADCESGASHLILVAEVGLFILDSKTKWHGVKFGPQVGNYWAVIIINWRLLSLRAELADDNLFKFPVGSTQVKSLFG
jgi:hypothetical protein